MVLDQPVIDYGHGKDRKRSLIATRREVEELDALQSAWEARRNGRSHVGETISLGEFMKGGS